MLNVQKKKHMCSIYCLKLQNEKYYVGRTTDIQRRFFEHLEGKGSQWTQKHKPIKIATIKTNATKWDEDVYVKRYMHKHGIDNVRGGSYSSIELSEEQKTLLQQEFRTVGDTCFECGREGHYAKDCPLKKNNDGGVITVKNKKVTVQCFKCGKCGHYANTCYVRRCFVCKMYGHQANVCTRLRRRVMGVKKRKRKTQRCRF